MANQCFGAGWTPSEGFKYFCWGAAAPEAEHGVAEAGSRFANLIFLIQTNLLKAEKASALRTSAHL